MIEIRSKKGTYFPVDGNSVFVVIGWSIRKRLGLTSLWTDRAQTVYDLLMAGF